MIMEGNHSTRQASRQEKGGGECRLGVGVGMCKKRGPEIMESKRKTVRWVTVLRMQKKRKRTMRRTLFVFFYCQ
jgi:hypothetical protein